jgi:ATP-dependent Lhr-like helicase
VSVLSGHNHPVSSSQPSEATDPAADPVAGPVAETVLGRFSALTRSWFTGAFSAPTAGPGGRLGCDLLGQHALVVAPTGSGKTLAAFLWALINWASSLRRRPGTALPSSLRLPAQGARRRRGAQPARPARRYAARRDQARTAGTEVRVGVRTGDTPADERRRLASHPPDVLITTPESLFLVLTSRARESLRGVRT